MKKCNKCNTRKLLGDFHLSAASKDGFQNYCKLCKKAYDRPNKLLRIYGLTQAAYDDILKQQNGRCAICERGQKLDSVLCVDHDHDTGQVRGLLCNQCNTGIGLLQDSIGMLASAIIYLEKRS